MNVKRKRHAQLEALKVRKGGRFAAGPDPRRHAFSPAERARGGRTRWEQILECMRRHNGELFPDSGCWGQWMARHRHKVK